MRIKQTSCASTLSAVSVGPMPGPYSPMYAQEGFTTEHHRQPPPSHAWTQPMRMAMPPTHYEPSSSSQMSPPSSPPPLPSSPPPLIHSRSPYATIDLPSLLPNKEGDLVVNLILERGPAGPALSWDVRTSPMAAFENADARPRRRQPTHDCYDHRRRNWMHQPATFPALGSVVIRSTAIANRPLVVFPASSNRSFVTVHDVVDAVHRAVLAENDELDDELLLSMKGNIDAIDSAAETRGRERFRSRPGWGRESRGWLWGGLTLSATEPEVWILLLQ